MGGVMATLTIRNVEDDLKQNLKIRAAHNNRSMEEEIRVILRNTVNLSNTGTAGLGSRIHDMFMEAGGIKLNKAKRTDKPRKPEIFS